ncbi:MAG: radical SAM protein [Lentisphaeria bacterium]|nr:radical SAM protein [Lentisphaeria bacterium]
MKTVCDLCPRQCNIDRSRMPGYCGMSDEIRIARAGLHMWEEPVISGERGSGTVFFSGCNLRCVFCQNYSISTGGSGKAVSVARLQEIYQELIAQGAHNINLVTPTHYLKQICESLSAPLPVPVVWNSNGYENVENLKQLEGKVQIYLPDLKYADNAIAMKYSAAPDYFERACSAIDEMFRQTGKFEFDSDGMLKRGVIVRHLILPGQVENSLRVIDHISSHFSPGDILFGLMRQYTPCGIVSNEKFPELNRPITDEEYKIVEDHLFASNIEDGYVQDKESASKQYIPDFDNSGV